MNLLGIVQGRLTETNKKNLQVFPKDWSGEFKTANKLKLDFIEFFTERKINLKNPIWEIKKIKAYQKYAKKNKLKIINFCDDHIISNSICSKYTFNYLKKLKKNLMILNVKNLILPMYDASNIDLKNISKISKHLKKIIKNFKKINILIESNISPDEFKKIQDLIYPHKIGFLFDTGNRANLKRDMDEDILSFNKDLKHIHIKDKNLKKKNVKLGTGLVDFNKVFLALKKIKYKKNFTLENSRGNNAINTALRNIKFIKKKIKIIHKKTSFDFK